MQQRYLLTPGGQRLYSTAKLDVEWENIFLSLLLFTLSYVRCFPIDPVSEGCNAYRDLWASITCEALHTILLLLFQEN